jgi:hypothetical protein
VATTAMTKTLVKDLKSDIAKLLGRGRTAFPCPLNLSELITLWHNMLEPDTVAAYNLLKNREFDTRSMSSRDVKFTSDLNGKHYEVQLVANAYGPEGAVFIEAPRNTKENRDGTLHYIHLRLRQEVERAFPDHSKYPAFLQWVENMAVIERNFPLALATLDDVLVFIGGQEVGSGRHVRFENSGTVGQLMRAIPDLHKYLPRDRQELLQQQKRSSNMPYAWASFDRSRIDHLQVCMAKASLMPKQNAEWSGIYQTGAHFV